MAARIFPGAAGVSPATAYRRLQEPGFKPRLQALGAAVVRASSLVENVNSRLRTYFFLRRQLGPDYLELLRFFLNHHRLQRSEREERVGKSPAELLSGQEQAHWLELLGHQRFARAA